MEIIVIVAGLVVVGLGLFGYFVVKNNKDRKESLTIMEDGDVVRLFLTDDTYDEFSIALIKDNKEKVYEEIKRVIKKRSNELVRLVDRVAFFKDGNKQQEQELLNIILSAKA
jgi:hypothetical protein